MSHTNPSTSPASQRTGTANTRMSNVLGARSNQAHDPPTGMNPLGRPGNHAGDPRPAFPPPQTEEKSENLPKKVHEIQRSPTEEEHKEKKETPLTQRPSISLQYPLLQSSTTSAKKASGVAKATSVEKDITYDRRSKHVTRATTQPARLQSNRGRLRRYHQEAPCGQEHKEKRWDYAITPGRTDMERELACVRGVHVTPHVRYAALHTARRTHSFFIHIHIHRSV